ncbi:peptide/nitrate transporter [Biomphalaria glabrata]|nr:peptide/nitrate transporter [Biomphalaria glabrata]
MNGRKSSNHDSDKGDNMEAFSGKMEVSERKTCSLLEWLTLKLKLVDDGAAPPNWKYIGLVFIALFSSASTLTFLFPFLPEMILTFGYKENEKGTYAGIIASAVFAGRVVGSVFWGWLADRQGRKIVLLITIGLNGLFAGLFGFADNIYSAVVFRFMCGVVNGTVGTAKTILYDISDNSNQALSMSMLSISWGMGLIVGPTVGGLLASPVKKWPHVFDQEGLFGQFPYLLSSIFPFVTCAIIFFVIYFYFDETFVVKSKRANQELVLPENTENGLVGVPSEKETQIVSCSDTLPAKDEQISLLNLGRSMQSVNVDLETFSYLGKDVTQSYIEPTGPKKRNVTSQSVPDLITLVHIDESATLSKSLTNVTANVSLNIQCTEGIDSGEKMPKLIDDKTYSNVTKENGVLNHSEDVETHNAKNVNMNSVSDTHSTKVSASLTCEEDAKPLIQNKATGHLQEDYKDDLEEDSVCQCMEVTSSASCCKPFRNTSLYSLLRLTDVWTTIMMYTVFSFTTIAVEDIFPVFASTTHDYGGLGFTTDEIGLAIGAMVLPLLFLQIKLYPYLVSKMGIRKVFLFSAMVSLVTCQALPTVRLLHQDPVWLWICLIFMQIPFKIATNCCFAGTSLLINNAVTQDLAGQANGLAMMTTAMGRTLAPVVAGSLFSWSITYGPELGMPFDSSFAFFAIGLLFFITIFECLHLNPRLDQQKKRSS